MLFAQFENLFYIADILIIKFSFAMENNSIVLHQIKPDQLKMLIQSTIKEELESIKNEMQRVIGKDDLVSTGTACRILGMCDKVFNILVKDNTFSVYNHLREKRFLRAELLEYREKYLIKKRN